MPIEKKISILGLKGAGKSTFLSILNTALALEESPWRIHAIGETKEKMKELRTYLSKGEYPPQTNEETEMEFIVEKEATQLGLQAGAQFKLHAADVPGEAVKGIASDNSLYKNFYERHLKGCSGVIFLLDYKEVWLNRSRDLDVDTDDYSPLFSSILDQIFEQTDTDPYVAFCVTKVDMDDRYGPDSKFGIDDNFSADVEDLAESILGRNTKAIIDHGIDRDRIKWLPVSATGFTENNGKRLRQYMEKVTLEGVTISAIRKPKELKPIGVAEALEWVLDNLADDDEDARVVRTRGKKYADMVKSFRKLFGNR